MPEAVEEKTADAKSVRLAVAKTKKLYIGGEFPRSESGRSFPLSAKESGKFYANIQQASRKDARNAVEAARKGASSWGGKTAFNRGQILYRMAEMLEARAGEISAEIAFVSGVKAAEAAREVETSIDRLVWYSGWCDKFQQLAGNHNPVSGSYFNFSVPEPMGVVVAVCPNFSPVLGFISQIAPILAGGNSVIALVSEENPAVVLSLAEVLATSDLPGGVVNVLTGYHKELLPGLAQHMDVNALDLAVVSDETRLAAETAATENLKRVRIKPWKNAADLYGDLGEKLDFITDFQEFKTIWHPIGALSASAGKY
ncbi:MAG: aldehyde dehydrogenase family protein [Spirochaetes bacterium]|nr:aldehyde dehydrogenase family protein [Spirochaetota bacterium]